MPRRVVLVIDGSAGMAPFLPKIAQALQPNLGDPTGCCAQFLLRFAGASEQMLHGPEFAVVFAGDDPAVIQRPQPRSRHLAASALIRQTCAGGQDNTKALLAAAHLAIQKPDSAIVWIHGPQPVVINAADLSSLAAKLELHGTRPVLYDFPVQAGPNAIARELDGLNNVRTVPRLSSLAEDLHSLLHDLSGYRLGTWTFKRQKRDNQPAKLGKYECYTSPHLARLRAFDEVKSLLKPGASGAASRALATQLATTYQLVTPVTGAVVLENAEQYKAAGLEPVPPSTVPTVPEPEVWMFLLLIAGAIIWLLRQKRAARQQS